MHILYFTAYPKQHFDQIIERDPFSISIACQKFNSNLIKGFRSNNAKIDVICPADLLIAMDQSERKEWETETDDEGEYHFCPQYHSKWKTRFTRILNIKKFILEEQNKDPDLFVVLDYLAPSSGIVASVSKRLTVIVTDMPEYMYVNGSRQLRKQKINSHYKIMHKADSLMLLTEQMAQYLKVNQKYTVIEGFADSADIKPAETNKDNYIMYCGQLSYACGIDRLTDAFHSIDCSSRLILYGDGDYRSDLMNMIKKDSRIVYGGVIPNEQAVQLERKAYLLVNPRPTDAEFTKFSFPSKNIEYMASGTALLTTKLPGMPTEYEPYVYLFPDDSTEGIKKGLQHVISLTSEERNRKAISAQKFISEEKTADKQVKRLIDCMQASVHSDIHKGQLL